METKDSEGRSSTEDEMIIEPNETIYVSEAACTFPQSSCLQVLASHSFRSQIVYKRFGYLSYLP